MINPIQSNAYNYLIVSTLFPSLVHTCLSCPSFLLFPNWTSSTRFVLTSKTAYSSPVRSVFYHHICGASIRLSMRGNDIVLFIYDDAFTTNNKGRDVSKIHTLWAARYLRRNLSFLGLNHYNRCLQKINSLLHASCIQPMFYFFHWWVSSSSVGSTRKRYR